MLVVAVGEPHLRQRQVEQVELVVVVMALVRWVQLHSPELLTLVVEVEGLELFHLAVALAALASSSSRSTNKDLWKPKSTDFSA
jgi:hypothetical protein